MPLPTSTLAGAAIVVVSLPFLLFPRRLDRLRHRHARGPEPTESGAREMRGGGVILFLFGLLVIGFV